MLNVSIVLYHPDWTQVTHLCEELLHIKHLRKIYLLDNSETKTEKLPISSKKIRYIFNNTNLGYGRAHNIAIRESVYYKTAYHLVINTDIEVRAQDIDEMVNFMNTYLAVGCMMPRVVYPNGELQYLCKLLPSPLDLISRRFLPKWMARSRNERFELRQTGYDHIMNVPYLSGCFMLLRTEAVLQARLFDERYFMYPEDLDLTRTIHQNWLTLYYPNVCIVHHHAQGSYHNPKLMWIHITNMCRYFNKWGWICDKERRNINRQVLKTATCSSDDK